MIAVAKIKTGASYGFEGKFVEVESDSSNGLPSLQIVGLGNKAIDEARERVKSAITNSLLDYPKKRITINLAPAQLPKDGTHYDLPIALSILASSGQLRQEDVANSFFAGELALDGTVRPIPNAISLAEIAKNSNIQYVYLPAKNIKQAMLVDGITLIPINDLRSLYLHLKKEKLIDTKKIYNQQVPTRSTPKETLDDIYGQEQAKRAITIAAAGHHNILMSGVPGAGKTMLARALANLLPDLTLQEQLEVTKMHGLAGKVIDTTITQRPFYAPHHSASRTALVGGGTKPKPGAISLAHHGVLFLDELPEYPRSSLEALRQPLEDRSVSISRAEGHISYPANFMLVATMNPCPCGYYGDTRKECSCTSTQITNYQKRLSGPFMDRMDLHVSLSRVNHDALLESKTYYKKQHYTALEAINKARKFQHTRYNSRLKNNANVRNNELLQHALIKESAVKILKVATDKLALSTRSYFKIIKTARTIADLDECPEIFDNHITEALQYRQST